jgi:hypothetical protein
MDRGDEAPGAGWVGRYVRTRSGVDGYEPLTLGVVALAGYDQQGRLRLAVLWRPEWQCAGEASPTWYGPADIPWTTSSSCRRRLDAPG